MTPAASAAKQRFDAIVIGTSAGGVDALSLLIPALPARLSASVFVVLHLPRDRPSLLVDLFEHRCALKVGEAQDKELPQPGSLYFAPPDYHLLIDAGPQIALSVDEPVNFSRPSIDVLFESAADIYRERLLGIILTGANEDGSAGLQAVQQAGGVAVVQQPESALMSAMPASAIERNPEAKVLSLPAIAALLAGLAEADGA